MSTVMVSTVLGYLDLTLHQLLLLACAIKNMGGSIFGLAVTTGESSAGVAIRSQSGLNPGSCSNADRPGLRA